MYRRLPPPLRNYRLPPILPTTIRTLQLLAFLHLFSTQICELRLCSGSSMLPTISNSGDWVLVSPLPYHNPFFRPSHPYKKPQRGDLVFAISPNDPGATVCKRVMALEGDVVEVEVRRHIDEEVHRMVGVEFVVGRKKGEGEWVKVPKGCVWLAGDNMSNSTDSRSYGPVPLGMIKGQVLARVWPGFKWFENPTRSIVPPAPK